MSGHTHTVSSFADVGNSTQKSQFCSAPRAGIQEKLGIINKGVVYAVFSYTAQRGDELHFTDGDCLQVLRKGDETERDWWWTRLGDREGYVPRNLLGVSALGCLFVRLFSLSSRSPVAMKGRVLRVQSSLNCYVRIFE